jgi:hypothetical protein
MSVYPFSGFFNDVDAVVVVGGSGVVVVVIITIIIIVTLTYSVVAGSSFLCLQLLAPPLKSPYSVKMARA